MTRMIYVQMILLLALLAGACSKKTFEAVKEPTALLNLESFYIVNLVQEPMKDGTVLWDQSIRSIEVEGVLRVNHKDKDFWFWQMVCPSQLKCNGAKVYFPVQATAQYDREKMPFGNALPATADYTAYVIRKADESHGIALLDFASNIKNPMPVKFLPELMRTLTLKHGHKTEAGRTLMANFALVGQFSQWDKATAEKNLALARFTPRFLRFTREAVEATKSAKGGAATFADELHRFMKDEYENVLIRTVNNFPWMAVAFSKLATKFMELNYLPGAQEKIFLQLLTSGDIKPLDDEDSPNGYAAFRRILNLPDDPSKVSNFEFGHFSEGLILKIAQGAGSLVFRCEFSGTQEVKDGISFTLKVTPQNDFTASTIDAAHNALQAAETQKAAELSGAPPSEKTKSLHIEPGKPFVLTFRPTRESKYLNVYQKFDQEAKALAQKVTPADFAAGITHNSLFLFAIKYGKGGFERSTGKFNYDIPLTKGKVYNTFLSMAKHQANNGSVADSTYSGPVDSRHISEGGGQQSNNVNWYQSAKDGGYSFYIRGRIDATYRSNHFSETIDELCFENNSVITVQFDPSELQSGKPKVKADFQTKGGICQSILSPKD